MIFEYKTMGLEKNLLYEVLATTISIETYSRSTPNTACMGIKIRDDDLISMKPYPTTKTFQNIKKLPLIILNFVDDILLYAIMALKESSAIKNNENSCESYYDFLKENFLSNYKDTISIPFVKDSWAIIICEVQKENTEKKVDELGGVNLTEFLMKPIYFKKFRESFKLYNRAENLILENIILATRLKVASKMEDKKVLKRLNSKIVENIDIISKFNKNERILKTLDYLNQFVKKFY
ncbi:MAG: DUF447 domain-containing protein [Candidatus Thorarchaeota archaeon]